MPWFVASQILSLLHIKFAISKVAKKKVALSKTEGSLAGNLSVKPALHCVITLILSKSN